MLAELPRIIGFEGRLLGGYPFDSAGSALAEQVSGQNLDPLFHRWLYKRGKPR